MLPQLGMRGFARSGAATDGHRKGRAASRARTSASISIEMLTIENARLHRQAESAMEMREEFLSMASHELKTPLAGLQLRVNGIQRALARSGPPDLQKIGSRMDSIGRQVRRLTTLVDGLLDVSRAGKGPPRLKTENMDLALVVRAVAERFGEELAARGSVLSLNLQGPILGRWDRLKVDEIVMNFLSNAIKYGAGKPIAISVRRAAAEVTIEVLDRGIGMSVSDQERIFTRFSRVASDQHYGGFGLGLWTTKVLVEAMGGRIEVQSAVGTGSSFRAFLPVRTKPREAS